MRFAYTALAVMMLTVYVSPAAAQAGGAKRILKQQQKQQQKQQKQGKMPALPGPALERFLKMTPQEQQQALEQLPPARRQQLMQRVRQFQRLPPDVQEQLRGRYEALLDLPQPRRQAVRQELQRLRRLTPDERKAQLDSADEQRNFSSEELDILRGVAAPQ
jgi:hypothetical protein